MFVPLDREINDRLTLIFPIYSFYEDKSKEIINRIRYVFNKHLSLKYGNITFEEYNKYLFDHFKLEDGIITHVHSSLLKEINIVLFFDNDFYHERVICLDDETLVCYYFYFLLKNDFDVYQEEIYFFVRDYLQIKFPDSLKKIYKLISFHYFKPYEIKETFEINNMKELILNCDFSFFEKDFKEELSFKHFNNLVLSKLK